MPDDRFELVKTIRLPGIDPDNLDDDRMMVYVNQTKENKPYAEVTFVNGASTFCVMGFGHKDLRDLAELLSDAADRLAYFDPKV